VRQGALHILHDQKRVSYPEGTKAVPIELGDVLLVQPKSVVVLRERKATLTLGSNAVFQIKADGGDDNALRSLFGRFQATVQKHFANEVYTVKTSTATIGVKGTEFQVATSAQGDITLLCTESVVEVTAPSGDAQTVLPGQVVVALNGKDTVTPAALPPEAVKTALSDNHLDSPPVTAKAASNLPAEASLVTAGIVTESELRNAKLTEPDYRDAPELDAEDRAPEVRYGPEQLQPAKPRVGPVLSLDLRG